jgi:hypothetical protein
LILLNTLIIAKFLPSAFPNFSETIWIWTFRVSNGWIIDVAKAPENPPTKYGIIQSYILLLSIFPPLYKTTKSVIKIIKGLISINMDLLDIY